MDDARWERIKAVFNAAMDRPAGERAKFLEAECGADADLKREVQSLLRRGTHEAVRTGAVAQALADAITAEAAVSEHPGTKIGPYKLLQLIGEGGFGVVFMADQESPVRRRVALKIIKLGMDTRQVVARFEQEREALAMMDHPNIARVLDAGATDSGRPYFVMEYVKGDNVVEFSDAHKLSVRERLDLFSQVCAAVQHAHSKGIIHRDIKPSNVLASMVDGRPFVKVIDFGIAKATGASGGRLTEKTLFTEHRQLIGTPEYMSPEQAEGLPDIDTRADVYGLGVLLYELLTGLTPFDAKRLRSAAFDEMRRIIKEEEPPAPSLRLSRGLEKLTAAAAARRAEPSRLSTLVKGELDWIVMKALDKDRARRYETASALADDVRRHLSGEPVLAAPSSAAYRLRKFVRKNKGTAVALSAVMLALVAGGSVAAWQWRGARRAEATQAAQVRKLDRAISEINVAAENVGKAGGPGLGAQLDPAHLYPGVQLHDPSKGVEAGFSWAPVGDRIDFLRDQTIWYIEYAGRATQDAREQADAAEWNAYTANLALAQTAITNHQWPEVRQRLADTPASKRGWEWRFLQAQAKETLYASATDDASLSPDGEWLLPCGAAGGTQIMRTQTGEAQKLDPQGVFGYSRWSPDSRALVVWAWDNSRTHARVFSLVDGTWTPTGSMTVDSGLRQAELIDNGHWFVAITSNGMLHAWDIRHLDGPNPTSSVTLEGFVSQAGLAASIFSSCFAVYGLPRDAGYREPQIWSISDTGKLQLVDVLRQEGGGHTAIKAISSDGTTILSSQGPAENVWTLWRRKGDGNFVQSGKLTNAALPFAPKIDPTGKYAVGISRCDGKENFSYWRLDADGEIKPTAFMSVVDSGYYQTEFALDGRLLFIGGVERMSVFEWPAMTLSDRWGPGGSEEHWSVWFPQIGRNGQVLIGIESVLPTAYSEKTWVGSLDTGRGTERVIQNWYRYSHPDSSAALSINAMLAGASGVRAGLSIATPDGSRIIKAAPDNTVRFYSGTDASNGGAGRELAVFRMPAAVTNLQMTADGLRLVISLADGSVRVWDIREPAERRKDLQAEWAERAPTAKYLDALWASTMTDEQIHEAILNDASLTPLRRLVAVEMAEDRRYADERSAATAFQEIAWSRIDKAAIVSAAEALDAPARVKAQVVAQASTWMPPEPTVEDKLAAQRKENEHQERAEAHIYAVMLRVFGAMYQHYSGADGDDSFASVVHSIESTLPVNASTDEDCGSCALDYLRGYVAVMLMPDEGRRVRPWNPSANAAAEVAIAWTAKNSGPADSLSTLIRLAEYQRDTGRPRSALKTLERASALCSQVADPAVRDDRMRAIAALKSWFDRDPDLLAKGHARLLELMSKDSEPAKLAEAVAKEEQQNPTLGAACRKFLDLGKP